MVPKKIKASEGETKGISTLLKAYSDKKGLFKCILCGKEEERDGSRRCGPPDRGQIACGHSIMGRENPLNGFSFFAMAAVGDGPLAVSGYAERAAERSPVVCQRSRWRMG